MSQSIIIQGITLDQFREELATIVRKEVRAAEAQDYTILSKRQLAKYCGISFHTLPKWLKEDEIESVTNAGLEAFKTKHRKYSRRIN